MLLLCSPDSNRCFRLANSELLLLISLIVLSGAVRLMHYCTDSRLKLDQVCRLTKTLLLHLSLCDTLMDSVSFGFIPARSTHVRTSNACLAFA